MAGGSLPFPESPQDIPSNDVTRAWLSLAQAGDASARDHLVHSNMRLVASVARRFQRPGIDFDDIFQVGCIGLVKAVDRFDLNFDVRFSTYAVPVIIGEIRQFLRDQHPVRLGRKMQTMTHQVAACRESLLQRLARQPTVGEIAQELSIGPEEVVAALEAGLPVASLDEPAFENDGDPVPLGDRIAATDDHERFIENAALKDALAGLEPWERRLVILRFFEEKSQMETAKELGVSQAHVSRTERRILAQFRDWFA